MIRAAALFILSCTVLLGCSDLPDLEILDSDLVKAADYPALVPLDNLNIAAADQDDIDEAARLRARAAALRIRARRLQALNLDEL